MKLKRAVMYGMLAALLVIGLGSCEFLGTSITQRVDFFVTDLNLSDRSNVYLNFTDATLDYGAIDATFWDTNFQVVGAGEQSYSIEGLDTVDPSNVTGTIYGPPAFDASGLGIPIRFVMIQDGVDWFIREIYLNNSATATVRHLF